MYRPFFVDSFVFCLRIPLLIGVLYNVYIVVSCIEDDFKYACFSCMYIKLNKSNSSMIEVLNSKRINSKLIQQICLTLIWTARNLSRRQFKLNETDTLKPVSLNTIRCFFNLLIQKSECNLDPKIYFLVSARILGSTRYTKVR